MKPAVTVRYRCVCVECEPLPPVENLHPASSEEGGEEKAAKRKGLLHLLAGRVLPERKAP